MTTLTLCPASAGTYQQATTYGAYATPALVSQNVNSEPVQTYAKTNIFEKYTTSPRHMANIILAIIGILVAIAGAITVYSYIIISSIINICTIIPITITSAAVSR